MLVDVHYSHVENFGQAIGWDIDFRQIDPGPLEAAVVAFGTDQFTVFRVEFDRSFHQLGKPPKGFVTLGLPDVQSGPLRWNGAETPPGVLINFNFEKELDCVNQPGQFGGYVLCLTPERMDLSAQLGGIGENILQSMTGCRFWSPETGQHEYLRELLNLLTTVARSEGDDGLSSWGEVFNIDVPVLMAQIIAGKAYIPDISAPRFRSAALQRAIEVLGNYEHLPGSVDSLCRMACCSWDTLKRGFKEEFGLTPKAYMKSRRLAAVQTELIRLGPDAVISDIANEWGFWHMGNFAAAYRKQFGELPSETLNRQQQLADPDLNTAGTLQRSSLQ